jgi:DNA topoisomerase-1
MAFTPEVVERYLHEDEFKVYRLVWNRFLASQMRPALFDQTTIDVSARQGRNRVPFRDRQGSPGYLKVYQEGKDDRRGGRGVGHRLPAVIEGEVLSLKAKPECTTEPPPRFTEASLVKAWNRTASAGLRLMSILSTIQEREYAKRGRPFTPTELGMIV